MYTSTPPPPPPPPPSAGSSSYTGNYTMQSGNQSTHSPNIAVESIPPETASLLKRQTKGPILWFANPPMNVLPLADTPVHSIAYLKWKEQQQQLDSNSK